MSVAAGRVVYNLGSPPCSGTGLVWTREELNKALDERIAMLLFDDEGKSGIEELVIPGEEETGFATEALKRILSDPEVVEDWRVGEAIAEVYLADHRDCVFPWPDSRDERKSSSSLPGADLVGFGVDVDGYCFAFGETKTSSDVSHPPNVMYGRTGLKKQLEDLRDSQSIRDDLVKYLGFRAIGASWRSHFEAAGTRYLKNSSDVMLFGVLVRDVPPSGIDMQARVHSLAKDCPEGTRIEILAIYLPEGCIGSLGTTALTKRNRT
ncbi:MAG: hypothetical protein F4Y84_19970 [Caldilineaceae bacterium SB0665_bin_25]|nr:hypothetical protein [Caldilineaceae bacterium SB0665_bin_25]